MAASAPAKPSTQAHTQQEVLFASRFIRYMHGNADNISLLLAVIAWLRSESDPSFTGNNPLSLQPGTHDAKLRSGVRWVHPLLTAEGSSGPWDTQTLGSKAVRVSVYKSIDAGARATANWLLAGGIQTGRPVLSQYGLMVPALQRAAVPAGKQTQAEADYLQAMDFLWAIILSKWDAGLYKWVRDIGITGAPLTDQNAIYGTTLYQAFFALLGQPVILPADAAPTTDPQPKTDPQPRALAHTVPVREYLDPTWARSFYEARNKPIKPIPGGYTKW